MAHAGHTLGRFALESELGRGAMGTVWRAVDPLIGRPVAIKVVDAAHFAADPEAREQFLHEARAAGRLSHPNIVTIFDAGIEGDEAYLVMEVIEGRSLRDMIASGDALPAFTIADIGAQIAEALDYAHAHGVVHRDVKPANIMLTASGLVKITDFGVARLEDAVRTRTGVVRGSPRYMAPEQVLGAEIDGRADLFALGVVLYEVITGTAPFGAGGGDLVALMKQIVNDEPPPPSALNRNAPRIFDTIVGRALRKWPAERYARGAELVNELRHYKALNRSLDPHDVATLILPAGGPIDAPRARQGRDGVDGDGGVADTGGVLGELRARAAAIEAGMGAPVPAGAQRSAATRELDARMRQALAYLREFARCVGVVQPAIPREYAILTETFRGLTAREAFVEHRSFGEGDEALVQSIVLKVDCASPQQIRFERSAAAIKPFSQHLADCGLKHTAAKVRNERRDLIGAVFRLIGEIRIEVALAADYTAGIVRIEAHNLERFGPAAFRVPTAGLDRELLDELGWLILGRASRFGLLAEREAGASAR